jgi:hypothetical protein
MVGGVTADLPDDVWTEEHACCQFRTHLPVTHTLEEKSACACFKGCAAFTLQERFMPQ